MSPDHLSGEKAITQYRLIERAGHEAAWLALQVATRSDEGTEDGLRRSKLHTPAATDLCAEHKTVVRPVPAAHAA